MSLENFEEMMAEVIILEIINDDDCFKFFSNTVDIY